MHAYLCFKKCRKAIENKKFVNKNKTAETLSHIRLHLKPEFFIQTQHVINVHVIWTIFDNLYHAIEFNAKFLLCKNLFSITLAKCGNNVETYFPKNEEMHWWFACQKLVTRASHAMPWKQHLFDLGWLYNNCFIKQIKWQLFW